LTQSAPDIQDVYENTPSTLGPVVRGVPYDQRIVARSDWLDGVLLLVALYGKPIRCRVRVSILDERRERVLRAVEADSATFSDNTWEQFSFDPIASSGGRTYWIRVESDAEDPEAALTLWTNTESANVCLRDGEPADCAICFMTHYAHDRVSERTDETSLGPLAPGDRLRQRFIARTDFLDAVSLWVRSAGAPPEARLRLTIEDERGLELRRAEASASSFRDGRWDEIRFEPIPDSRGRTYGIRLESDVSGMTFWANAAVRDAASTNGEPTGAALCFKTLYGRKAKGPSTKEYCCVRCSSPVEFERRGDALHCPACGTAFAVLGGEIPVFVDEALGESNYYGAMFGEDAAHYNLKFNVDARVGASVLERLGALEPRLASPSFGSVLEIGAGAGHLTRALAEGRLLPHRRLYVSDLSGEMLHANWLAQTEAERRRGPRYLVTNVLNLPFADGALDLVIGFDVLHHVLDYPRGLREIARALSPEGMCVLMEPNREPYRLFAFLVRMVVRLPGLTAGDRSLLAEWERCFYELLRHDDAGDHDALAHVDDKYYFDKDVLRARAIEAGFREVTEYNVVSKARGSVLAHETFYTHACMEFFGGVGVSADGLAVIADVARDLDFTVGDLFLRDYPPNSVFVFCGP
jgi:ubiquinone/menaquinone biosynthesis C-methylase UbiE